MTVLGCSMMILIPQACLFGQVAPTLIPENFETYDLFEFDLTDQWYYLPNSDQLTLNDAAGAVDSFIKAGDGAPLNGWWMLYLRNESPIAHFALRAMNSHEGLEVYQLKDGRVTSADHAVDQIFGWQVPAQTRLLSTAFALGQGEEVRLLVRGVADHQRIVNITLNSLDQLIWYAMAVEKLSLVFSVFFFIVLMFNLGIYSLFRSSSYLHYSLLATGYLAHALGYQVGGWVSPSFAADYSILSATLISFGGISLWRSYLQINEGPWLWLFRILKFIGFAIIMTVGGYLLLPRVFGDLNPQAALAAALLALAVLLTWLVSGITMYFQKKGECQALPFDGDPDALRWAVLCGGLAWGNLRVDYYHQQH